MKKSKGTIRWIGVVIFGLMAIGALSSGGFLGALLFILGGAIIAPVNPIEKLRKKLKLSKALSIVLAVVLLCAGALLMPESETSIDDAISSGISETVSNKDNSTNNESSNTTSKKEENTSSKKEETTSKPTTSSVGTGKAEAVNLSNIPAYSGKAYVTINNNIPNFSAAELKTTGYETYSNLDSLGRTQTAIASVGKDTMPKANEERGSISSVKPTGWIQAQYDCISGKYLYNRCHLIGWQLSAENANKKNLITGTKYFNISGMLPFENMVADYIKETGNHVAYRITPIYQGNNLLASGVQMEAYSIEDEGEGICFNVYCYNVQPDVKINYATGASSLANSSSQSEEKPTTSSTSSSSQPDETPSTDNSQQDNSSQTVYVTATGKRYHSRTSCSGLNNAKAIYESTLSSAKNQGLTPCSICH